MRNEALRLYTRRKSGWKQSAKWKARTILSSLLLLFITACLSFALVFIQSMGEGLETVLQLLGSGSFASSSLIDSSLLPEDTVVNEVKTASAIAYGENTALVSVKAVDESYFFPLRSDKLGLERVENTTSLKTVIISKLLAHELGVEPGGRLALMMYEGERARPVYLFVEGVYSTGYSEFDSRLVFSSFDLVDGNATYEYITESDVDSLVFSLRSEGYRVYSYKELYPSIYQNIGLSMGLLNVIVTLIAFLSGFFALSLSAEYIERDRRDIALMLLMGVREKDMAACYLRITLLRVFYALAIGLALGVILACLFIPLLSKIDTYSLPALQSYVTNFDVVIPFGMLLLVFLALMLAAWLSLAVSLSKGTGSRIRGALVS